MTQSHGPVRCRVALSTTSTTGPAIPASLATALTTVATLSGDTSAAHDGTVNWSFDLANSEVQYLAAGETVTAAYTITITDHSDPPTPPTRKM